MNNEKTTVRIEGKDVILFTTVYPNANAETIILLHGGPGVPDDLTFIAQQLSQNFQIISFHQRGTKQSPISTSDYSIESYVSDINHIATYFNINTFHLFGHSWGGLYAQIYAQKYPEKISSLFLSSPSSGTGLQWREMEREVMSFNISRLQGLEWLSMGWNSLMGIFGSNKAYQKVAKQVLINYDRGFEYTADNLIDLTNVKAEPINKTRKQLSNFPALNVISHPAFRITIIYGDKDIYGESKKHVLVRYPTVLINTIENCGHFPFSHNRGKFIELLNLHFSTNLSQIK